MLGMTLTVVVAGAVLTCLQGRRDEHHSARGRRLAPDELMAMHPELGVHVDVDAHHDGEAVYLDVALTNDRDHPIMARLPTLDPIRPYVRDGWLVVPSLAGSLETREPAPPCSARVVPQVYVGPGQRYRETLRLPLRLRTGEIPLVSIGTSRALLVFEVIPLSEGSQLDVEGGYLHDRGQQNATELVVAQIRLPASIETSPEGGGIERTDVEAPVCPPLVTPRWRGGLELCGQPWPGWPERVGDQPSASELDSPSARRAERVARLRSSPLTPEEVGRLDGRLAYFASREIEVLERSEVTYDDLVEGRERTRALVAAEELAGRPHGSKPARQRYDEAFAFERNTLQFRGASTSDLLRIRW